MCVFLFKRHGLSKDVYYTFKNEKLKPKFLKFFRRIIHMGKKKTYISSQVGAGTATVNLIKQRWRKKRFSDSMKWLCSLLLYDHH